MRLFIAINFSEEVKNKIGRIIEKLKERSVGGNFTRRENLHLTLVFLGETPESRIGAIKKAMAAARADRPQKIELRFSDLGSFSDILWLGIRPNEELGKLQRALADELTKLGFKLESRGFKPHITICRKASLPRDFNKAELLEEISEISTAADDIVLMKSERISGRLTYTPI